MRIFRSFFLAASLGLASLLGLSAADFEGTINLSIKEGHQATQDISYATKDGKLRVSIAAGPMGEMNSIIDIAGGKILVIMAAQKMYMEMPIAGQVEAAINERVPSADRMIRSDESAEILGYPCRKYTFDEPDGPVEIWATDQLGQFVAMPKGNPMQPPPAQESWDQFITGDFFPMRIVSLNNRGQERRRWEVTQVTPQKLSPALFAVPEGFRKFDMGAMMQGLGGLLGN